MSPRCLDTVIKMIYVDIRRIKYMLDFMPIDSTVSLKIFEEVFVP
jgi:hypothetical protein